MDISRIRQYEARHFRTYSYSRFNYFILISVTCLCRVKGNASYQFVHFDLKKHPTIHTRPTQTLPHTQTHASLKTPHAKRCLYPEATNSTLETLRVF